MSSEITREEGLRRLRMAFEEYAPLSDETWSRVAGVVVLDRLGAGEHFTRLGERPRSFGFVCRGLLRGYAADLEGREYNKIFFPEGTFPGSMVALHTGEPATFAVEALEPTVLMRIDFRRFRSVLRERPDLMWFQIRYLERNWLLAKEPREVALVQEDATARYLRFRAENPGLEERLPQYHVASHVGVTPTQLSRIRRSLREG